MKIWSSVKKQLSPLFLCVFTIVASERLAVIPWLVPSPGEWGSRAGRLVGAMVNYNIFNKEFHKNKNKIP